MAHKILVVDDDDNLRKIVAHLLDKSGYATITAEDGEKALAILETEEIGMVILDVMMPGLSGYELCEKMQADEKLAQLPVLMLTGKVELVDKFQGFMSGAGDYMTKPFKNQELLEKVRELYTY